MVEKRCEHCKLGQTEGKTRGQEVSCPKRNMCVIPLGINGGKATYELRYFVQKDGE